MDPFDRRAQDRLLAALASDQLSGFEALGRIEVDGRAPGKDAFLYPALHSLEAAGKVAAEWSADEAGRVRRRYRRARGTVETMAGLLHHDN